MVKAVKRKARIARGREAPQIFRSFTSNDRPFLAVSTNSRQITRRSDDRQQAAGGVKIEYLHSRLQFFDLRLI